MVDWLFKALCSLTAEVRSWFTLSINIIYYFRCSVLPRVLTGSHVIHLLWCSMIGDNNYNSRNIFLRYWGVFRWVVVVLEVDKMVSKDLVWAGRARKGWWWGAGSESCQGQSVGWMCLNNGIIMSREVITALIETIPRKPSQYPLSSSVLWTCNLSYDVSLSLVQNISHSHINTVA